MGRANVSEGPACSFCLLGPVGAGKTQLAEAILHAGGAVREAGRVADGTSLLDADALSRARRCTQAPGLGWLVWGERTLYLIDTPGSPGLAWPAAASAAVSDVVVWVQPAHEPADRASLGRLGQRLSPGQPLMVVASRLDLGTPDAAWIAALSEATGRRVVALQHAERDGNRASLTPAWADEGARERMMEAAAMGDDALLSRYLEDRTLPEDLTEDALRAGFLRGEVVPVLQVDAVAGVGVAELLDRLVAWAPPPVPDGTVAAQWAFSYLDEEGASVQVLRVWRGVVVPNAAVHNARSGASARLRKVYRVRGPRRALVPPAGPGSLVAVWDDLPGEPGDTFVDGAALEVRPLPPAPPPMAWLWVRPPRPADLPRLHSLLDVLRRLDPAWTWADREIEGGVHLAGHHTQQLALVAERLRSLWGSKGDLPLVELPRVRYRERPVGSASEVVGRHVIEDEDEVYEHGECIIDLAPAPPEVGILFASVADPDDVLPRFAHAVGEGARRALQAGPRGLPVVGAEVVCLGGSYDALASTEAHFERAGELAVSEALRRAGTEVLEPWQEVRLSVPASDMGIVLGDLSAHRGRVIAVEVEEVVVHIDVQLPERELLRLAGRLEAMIDGLFRFQAWPSHLERLPADCAGDVTSAAGGRA